MLVLIPTQFELDILQGFESFQQIQRLPIELCGFGAIVAAARTAFLLEEHNPDRALLLGIAGTLSDRLKVGEAYEFDQVVCHGIGVGSGENFRSAEMLDWNQWSGAKSESNIGDKIVLREGASQLLTCTSASNDENDLSIRKRLYPDSLAEDMEGFSVAAACHLAGVPLRIVRGISNVVGDRDKSHWQIKTALQSALELVLKGMDGE